MRIKNFTIATWERLNETSKRHGNKDETCRSIECKISSPGENKTIQTWKKFTSKRSSFARFPQSPFCHESFPFDSTVINVDWLRTRVSSIRSLPVFSRHERVLVPLTPLPLLWIRKQVGERWNNEIGGRIEGKHFDIVAWCAANILIDSFRRRWVFPDVLCG